MDETIIEMNLKALEEEIKSTQKEIEKINKKQARAEKKGKTLSNSDANARNVYQKQLDELLKEKDNLLNPKDDKADKKPDSTKTSVTTSDNKKTDKDNKPEKSLEESLTDAEKRAQEAADQLNSKELKEKKLEDTTSTLENARTEANQIDAATEENIPHWFWREAQEMAPTDKAKRGFIITNHILNRLGTTLGNIGAVVQNAGGSGGAKLQEHGGSYIDQYRQNKLEQALTNRKTKQEAKMQAQVDAFEAINVPENEIRAIQRRLRNASFGNKYERLSDEQKVYLQGLIYNDTEGKISDAMLGNIIDQIMEGKAVSLEQVAVNSLTAAGLDNIDKITTGAQDTWNRIKKFMNWDKPGE